jgi:hypothetical protein
MPELVGVEDRRHRLSSPLALTSARRSGFMSTTGVPSIASSGPHSQLECRDPENGDAVQSQRVRSVGRPRREDPGERTARVAPRVYLQHVASGLVEPGDDEDLVADRDPLEPVCDLRCQLDRRIGRSLAALLGRRLPVLSMERTTPIGFSRYVS